MPIINDSYGLIAILLIIPALIFATSSHPVYGKMFKVFPPIVLAYFVPTFLTFFGVIPAEAPIYKAIKTFVLPASLLLLTIAVDIKGILRLGKKAVIMFLSGTLGVIIGGPLSLWIWQDYLPADVWQGMAALAGSWIGGGANFVAMGSAAGASSEMLGSMVVVDVICANIWTGTLMYLAGRYLILDKKLGADNSAIEDLKQRVIEFQMKTARVSSSTDFMIMAALAFGFSWISIELGKILPEVHNINGDVVISASTWKVILITTIAVVLSYTKFKNYEGAGASKLGTVLLYMLIGVIGAGANLHELIQHPYLIAMGFTWVGIHVVIMLVVMKILKAPLFFMAVGSQANLGGAASAPVVASAFHPSLATVGVMMGIGGYVLGTYGAMICMYMLQLIAG